MNLQKVEEQGDGKKNLLLSQDKLGHTLKACLVGEAAHFVHSIFFWLWPYTVH